MTPAPQPAPKLELVAEAAPPTASRPEQPASARGTPAASRPRGTEQSPAPEVVPVEAPKSYTIRGIPVSLMSRFWPYAIPYIKRALDRSSGEFTVDDLHRFALNSHVQLWLVHDGTRIAGAVTTEIVYFPSRNRLRVLTLSGNEFDLWADVLDRKLQEWALTNKCDGIEAYVRRGFVARLRKAGYRHKVSQVWKAIAPSAQRGS